MNVAEFNVTRKDQSDYDCIIGCEELTHHVYFDVYILIPPLPVDMIPHGNAHFPFGKCYMFN